MSLLHIEPTAKKPGRTSVFCRAFLLCRSYQPQPHPHPEKNRMMSARMMSHVQQLELSKRLQRQLLLFIG